MPNCKRPHCKGTATAYIPLPLGCREPRIYLCALHEKQARAACFYLHSIADIPDSEDAFHRRVRTKHLMLRRTPRLTYAGETE